MKVQRYEGMYLRSVHLIHQLFRFESPNKNLATLIHHEPLHLSKSELIWLSVSKLASEKAPNVLISSKYEHNPLLL